MLDTAALTRLKDAAGLAGVPEDGWSGSRVVVMQEPRGFITCTPRDPRFSGTSNIALIGGGFFQLDDGRDWKGFDQRLELLQLGFTCTDATFVAVDFYGQPERVFLYPQTRGFNAELIIELLATYRKYTTLCHTA